MKQDARFLSVKILNRFEKKNEQLSLVRNQIMSSFKPEPLVKSRTMVLTNEIIRLKDRLDLMVEHVSGRKIKRLDQSLLSILRIGFFEIIYDDAVPDYASVDSAVNLTKVILNRKASGLTNAVLRNLLRYKEKGDGWDSVLRKNQKWNSIPGWLQKRWNDQFGESGAKVLMQRINQVPKTFIRVNLSRVSLDEVHERLSVSEIDVENFSDNYLRIKFGIGKIFSHELFQSGLISVQDPAAGGIVEFLDPIQGETILDVCAAPGTKSLFIAERVGATGRVFSSDSDPIRVKLGKNDIERHRQAQIEWSIKDATKDKYPTADKILIDVPCTGTGVIGRKPDIRWRRKLEDIKDMATLQFQILNHMSQFLNPEGTLVYGTCSLEPEENWKVVEQFLKLKSDFQLVTGSSRLPDEWINKYGYLQTLPHVHGVDGMFAAKLKRK